MKEAYVSYEVAKLLKEKGFDWEIKSWYKEDGTVQHVAYYDDTVPVAKLLEVYPRPTQQTACRWLRKEHNICISIIPCEVGAGVMDYTYCIYEIQADDYHFKPICQGRIEPVAYTCDYEGTVEAALKYCLTDLI